MMLERTRWKPGPILSALLGLAAFFISSLAAAFVILKVDNYILATAIAGGLGGLLLGWGTGRGKKSWKLGATGVAALPTALLFTFLLAGVFELLLPAGTDFIINAWIPDVLSICLRGMIFGGICGGVIFGRKRIGLFILVCGIVSIPFGILVAAMNAHAVSTDWLTRTITVLEFADLNFVSITVSLGLGLGLGIGICNRTGGTGG